jgi:peptide deformylase
MLKIVTIPNPKLRERSKELDRDVVLTDEIQELAKEMIPIMYQADGVGLAAPQVEKNIRICTISKEAMKKDKKNTLSTNDDLVLINPVWNKLSRKTGWDTEGCLSVPKTYGKVKRYTEIHVQALGINGNLLSFDAHNFFARVIQHEVDHLDGILFIDKAKDIYTVE